MADETVDLNFIGAQLGKLLDGQRETNERLGELENGMSELQMAVAATRADLRMAWPRSRRRSKATAHGLTGSTAD